MISTVEQKLYNQYSYWIDFYMLNNFFYFLKFNYINLTYANAILFHKPTIFKYSLTKEKKRKLLKYLNKNFNNSNLYFFLSITNAFFIWNKQTQITNLYGIINLNKYFLKLTNFSTLVHIKNFFFSFLKFKFNNYLWFRWKS